MICQEASPKIGEALIIYLFCGMNGCYILYKFRNRFDILG